VQHTVKGSVLPVLEVELNPGESIIAEAGEFSWMTDSVQMTTNTGGGIAGKGLLGAVKRMAGGSTFMFTTYTAEGQPGMVAFAAKVPGSIFQIEVSDSQQYRAHRHGFLAGTQGLEVSVGLQQQFRSGIFGGEGFLLQTIGGTGQAWIELSGEVIAYDLAPGQTMRAHPGHVGLFQASVNFTVVRVPGLANRYMGSDGHHFAVLTGPGRIWLQSMPVPLLAGAIQPYVEKDSHPVEAGAIGGTVAGALGSLFGK
jgi:uncharacterized protein (TIGR00266 family)